MEAKIFSLNQAERVERGEYTDFLDPTELNLVRSILNKKHVKYEIFKSFDDSEKSIVYSSFPKVSLIEIISDSKLNHKDILGSLFSHNINISKYGDIVITDKYYLPILDSIKPYILSNFNKIGNNIVKVKEVDIDIIKDYKYEYEEKKLIVSSLRIDNIVSVITNSSRNSVDMMFKNKYIFINYISDHKKTYMVKENDIIGIRKNGKYKFIEVMKTTSKNKYIIKLLKYK